MMMHVIGNDTTLMVDIDSPQQHFSQYKLSSIKSKFGHNNNQHFTIPSNSYIPGQSFVKTNQWETNSFGNWNYMA